MANSKSPSFIEIKGQVKELAVQVWSEQEDKHSLNIELDIEELKVHKVWIKNVTAIQTHFAINAKSMRASEPKIKLNIPGFTWDPEATNTNMQNKVDPIYILILTWKKRAQKIIRSLFTDHL